MSLRAAFFLALVICLLGVVSCGHSAKTYIDRAKRAYNEGKYEDSALNSRKALQSDSRAAQAYYWLGLAELKLDHPREAYAALSRSVELAPKQEDAKTKLADLVVQAYLFDPKRPAGLYDQATKLSSELLAKDPNSYHALIIKTYLALTDRHPGLATAFLRRAEQARPNQPETSMLLVQALMQDNQAGEGERVGKQLIVRNKTYTPIYDVLYSFYRRTNRLADAEAILRQKVANNPTRPEFVSQLAMHFAEFGKRAEMNAALEPLLHDAKLTGAHLVAGDFYVRVLDYDHAIEQYQAGQAAEPSRKALYEKRLAMAFAAKNKPDDALRMIEDILQQQPEDAESRMNRAMLLVSSGRSAEIDKGISEIKAMLSRNDRDPSLHYKLAQALQKKGDPSGAKAEYLTAVSLRPTYPEAISALVDISRTQRDFKGMLRYADQLLAFNPENRIARLNRSRALIGAGDYDQARLELAKLLRTSPQDRDALLELATINARQGKVAEAETAFRKYYNPGQPDLRPLRGLMDLMNTQGQYNRSIRLLTEDLAKSSNPTAVRVLIAGTAVQAHQYPIAIAQYEQLLKENPQAPDLYVAMGATYQLNHQLPKAIENFEKARKLAPDYGRALEALGVALQISGRQKEATECYRRLAQLRPNDPTVLNNLAFLISETGGNLDEALKLAGEAQKLSPADPAVLDTLGTVYLRKNKAPEAIGLLSSLVRKYPGDATYHYHYGLALLRNNDASTARTELETALECNPPPDISASITRSLNEIR